MITECTACRLHLGATKFVFASGDPESGIVFVGEAPGAEEDRDGVPFVGPAGELLTELLGEIGLSRDQVYVTGVVRCFPSDGGRVRIPVADEVAACTAKWLFPELRALSPLRVLVPVGSIAASAVIGADVRIGMVHGTVVQTEYCARTMPVFHPAHVLSEHGSERDRLLKLMRVDFARIGELVAATAPGVEVAGRADSIQLSESELAQFEQRLIQAPPWRPERKYVAGWSDGADIVLMYYDDSGSRKLERVSDFPWYFYMRSDDVVNVPIGLWERWKRQGVFRSLEVDGVSEDWTKIFAYRKVTQSRWLIERGEIGVGLNVLDDPRDKAIEAARVARGGIATAARIVDAHSRTAGTIMGRGRTSTAETAARARGGSAWATRKSNWEKFPSERLLHDFLIQLHAYGLTFEADLTPRQRFMSDNQVTIDERYGELFFDIETDDSVPGWEEKETWRHLSYAAVLKCRDGSVERHSLLLSAETDVAEKAMLLEFREILKRSDVLYAWNGFNFDFPILRARFRRYGIEYDWRHVVWCDLLSVWRRYHYRSASAVTSYALGELAPVVLQREKLDWRAEAIRRGTPASRYIDLYRANPSLLVEYNERDADLLYSLEDEFGYAAVDRVFSRLGNCFANDFHISTKVDMLLLNRGAVNGKHFVTRGLQLDILPAYISEQQKERTRVLGVEGDVETVATGAIGRETGGYSEYTGAFVFPPVVGYHEGVADLDFKALYPSIMLLFNISPETWVSRDDVGRHAPEELTLTPSGAHFRKVDDGMIPLVFRETMERRKVYTKLQMAEVVGSQRFLLFYRLSVCSTSMIEWVVGKTKVVHSAADMWARSAKEIDVADDGVEIAKVKGVLAETFSDGRLRFLPVKYMMRHRLGEVRLIKVTLENGRSVTVTDCHSLMVVRENALVPIRACDVELGDIMLSKEVFRGRTDVEGHERYFDGADVSRTSGRDDAACLQRRDFREIGMESRRMLGLAGSFFKSAEKDLGTCEWSSSSGYVEDEGRKEQLSSKSSLRPAEMRQAIASLARVAVGQYDGLCREKTIHESEHENVGRTAEDVSERARALAATWRTRSAVTSFCWEKTYESHAHADKSIEVRATSHGVAQEEDQSRAQGVEEVGRMEGEGEASTAEAVPRSGTERTFAAGFDEEMGDVPSCATFSRVVSVEPVDADSEDYVYDIEMAGGSCTFIANGILVHNSYAYKRLGLSFYGELGNETSRYFNPEIAEAVTLSGQWLIKKTAAFAERYGYDVLAGDTDSIFLKMSEAQAAAFVLDCDAYYRELLGPYNVDMSRFSIELEYENYFKNIIFVRKKRYAGKMVIFKGKASDVLEVKGLECMRSDGIEYARQFQRKVLLLILDGNKPPAGEIVKAIEAARAEIYSGTLPVDMVTVTQSIEKSVDDYKSRPPHVRVAEHIRDVSTEYTVGMKVPYVMVPGAADPDKPGRLPPLVPVWAREYVEGTYDPGNVWNKRTYPATLRVLEVVYPGEDWQRFFVVPDKPAKPAREVGKKKVGRVKIEPRRVLSSK